MPIDPRTGYFYPQLNNNIHINSFDYPTFLLQDAVPLALSGAGRLFASGSGDRESVYYLRSSGQIIDLYNTEGYLDIEILDELTIDGVVTSSTDANSVQFSSSITFHNDSPNFHLDSLNSSLILSSSHNSEIYVSGNLGVEEDVNLKLASKLVFDSDTDSNTYITKNGTDGYLEFFMNGTRTLMMINSRTLFYTSPEFTAGLRVYSNQSATMYDRAKLNLGSSGDYWQAYNNAATPISGAFEFWSSNIDDNGTDSKIYWIEDGTKNINFSSSHVFGVDADPNSAHIISTQSDLIFSSSHNSTIAISGNLDMKNNDINNVNALYFNTAHGSSLDLSFRTATSDYKLTDTDYAVEVQAWNNDVEIMLPTANGIPGREYRVILNSSGSYDLTVAATGSETINGHNFLTIQDRYVALSLISTGFEWLIT
jgi:hypothetical protein